MRSSNSAVLMPHDDGAVDLAFRQPRVDDQAAILHGHVAVDVHDAGFGIHRNVGDLHARRALRVQPARAALVVLAHFGDLAGGPDLLAGRRPGQALGGSALHADAGRPRPPVASGCAPSEGATASNSLASAFMAALRVDDETPPTVVDPPDAPRVGQRAVADVQLDGAHRQPQRSRPPPA